MASDVRPIHSVSVTVLADPGAAGRAQVDMVGVSKRYDLVVALADAAFSCELGEVHALVGENGAGKSTLIKILAGIVKADAGVVRVGGQVRVFANPRAAIDAGIGSVFQELSLCPNLTVAENIFSIAPPVTRFRTVSRRRLQQSCEELFEFMGLDPIDPDRLAGELSLRQRQLVEIAKVVSRRPTVYVFDEATSALDRNDAEWLAGFAKRLAVEGRSVIYISHKLHEILALADRTTVFRNGQNVGTRTAAETSADELVQLMLGRAIQRLYPTKQGAPKPEVVLEAKGVRAGARLSDITFSLHVGEILGVGGLAGQGQEELFRCLYGVDPATGGELSVDGRRVHVHSPRDALDRGIALVPADRASEGLLLSKSIAQNISIVVLDRLTRFGVLSMQREKELVGEFVQRLEIKTSSVSNPASQLSGGNQQKVVIAKLLASRPRILLLFDCTRGVDVGTKAELFTLLRQLADEGTAILFYSTDTDELVNMCDRVLILRSGTITAEIPGSALTTEMVVRASLGAHDATRAPESSIAQGHAQ